MLRAIDFNGLLVYCGVMTKKDVKKNKGGRPKGSTGNRYRTDRVRAAIGQLMVTDFTLSDIRRLISDIEEQEGAKGAFDCYMKLAKFCLPELARIEHTGKDGDTLTIAHALKDMPSPKIAGGDKLAVSDESGVVEVDYSVVLGDGL